MEEETEYPIRLFCAVLFGDENVPGNGELFRWHDAYMIVDQRPNEKWTDLCRRADQLWNPIAARWTAFIDEKMKDIHFLHALHWYDVTRTQMDLDYCRYTFRMYETLSVFSPLGKKRHAFSIIQLLVHLLLPTSPWPSDLVKLLGSFFFSVQPAHVSVRTQSLPELRRVSY